MPSAPAERALHKAGRPLWWVTGLVLCMVVAVTGYLLSNRPQEATLPSGGHHGNGRPGPVVDHEAAGSALVSSLVRGLRQHRASAVEALAAPGDASAAAQLADIAHNVMALPVVGLSMRYVAQDAGGVGTALQNSFGGRAWVADVELSWRVAGYDRAASHEEVTLVLVQTPRGAAFASARPGFGDRAPLWLVNRVRVRRSADALVMVAGHQDLHRFATLADRAVHDVTKVLHRWRGRLVVEVPPSQQVLDRLLAVGRRAYADIAAVTTTVDGSLSATAPVHIFVNPAVFDPLGPHGSQIVMSHEATHVATGAATSAMPTWLLEGFADFVALDHVALPVSVTASQILAQVRKQGVPAHLPTASDFDTASSTLGATYESAWLACRLLGRTYGERRLIEFYRESNRDGSTRRAFHQVLGTDQAAFTRQWQNELRRLARR